MSRRGGISSWSNASVTDRCVVELLYASEATLQGKKCSHTKHFIKKNNRWPLSYSVQNTVICLVKGWLKTYYYLVPVGCFRDSCCCFPKRRKWACWWIVNHLGLQGRKDRESGSYILNLNRSMSNHCSVPVWMHRSYAGQIYQISCLPDPLHPYMTPGASHMHWYMMCYPQMMIDLNRCAKIVFLPSSEDRDLPLYLVLIRGSISQAVATENTLSS